MAQLSVMQLKQAPLELRCMLVMIFTTKISFIYQIQAHSFVWPLKKEPGITEFNATR